MKTISRELLLEAVQEYVDSLSRDLYYSSSESDKADIRDKLDTFDEIEDLLLHEEHVEISD